MANPLYGTPPRYVGGQPISPTGYGDLSNIMPSPMGLSLPFSETIGKYPMLYPGAGLGYGSPAASSGGAWGNVSFAPPTTQPAGGGGVPGVPGAQLLQTAKFPQINTALNAALGRTNADGASLVSSVRDPNQAAAITAAQGTNAATTGQENQTLADFTKAFLAGDPTAKAMTDAQTGAIGAWYGPASDPNSVQGSLNKLAGQRWQAIQASLGRALGAARGNSNLARLGMGGNSSYANAQFDDAAAGILANAAASQADLNRNNYLAVLQGQTQNAGLPQNLLNSYLTRNLTPIQAALQTTSGQLANLGALGNIRNQNTIDRTQQQFTAEQIANINAILAGLNQANISGIGANYQLPNMGAIPRAGGSPPPPTYSGNYGNPPGITLDATTGQPVTTNYGTPPGDINPATGQPWTIPPSQLASYIAGSGVSAQPQYQSNAGTGTGGVGNMVYVPGLGYVPVPTAGFDYGSPGGQPVVTESDMGVTA